MSNESPVNIAGFYKLMAALLEYPTQRTESLFAEFSQAAILYSKAAAVKAEEFLVEMTKLSLSEREELYVATFDVQAACCLDVGYVTFGEDYKRGQFMAEMKVLMREHQIEIGTELPDFLPNILRLLPKVSYAEAQELVEKIVAPAIVKMQEPFSESFNPYKILLSLVHLVMSADYLGQGGKNV